VSTAVVKQLRAMGADPAIFESGFGPSISPDRYQVGAEVADASGRRRPRGRAR